MALFPEIGNNTNFQSQSQSQVIAGSETYGASNEYHLHWKKILDKYNDLGIEELNSRHKEVERILRENGVTYNIYGDPYGPNRPWNLDPIPLIFSSEDWKRIEKGVKQRAELLNLILKDIYTDRKTIKEGILPMDAIFHHRGFLRQMDKVLSDYERHLIIYSADLARGPNGKMWVLSDRTDAPSGAGYTLENRTAMARVFPELFKDIHVSKISSYYQVLKNTLSRLNFSGTDNPSIALYSPGPNNETFFEHSYFSTFLGLTLVFGEDLTVRDGTTYLRTIQGLEKIDVILRRVDDRFCDPLELDPTSKLGVVGLLESARQKKVSVVNPLGCRILENPALMAFLPSLCKYFLNEDLILPSVATWWCGQEKEMDYVVNNIDNLIIRRIYRKSRSGSVIGRNLSKANKEKIIAEIKTRPYLYVGQEIVDFSTSPSLVNGNIEERNFVFRSFTVADVEKKEYKVMPGGLSRTSPTNGIFIVSNQSGGVSKDTWVIEEDAKEPSMAKQRPVAPSKQFNIILPSRTGENIFWLGRYLDRIIYGVRLLRVVLKKHNEFDKYIDLEGEKILDLLFESITHFTLTYPGFVDEDGKKRDVVVAKEIISLVIDENRAGTIGNSLNAFLYNGYSVRDRLSIDTWRIIDNIKDDWYQLKNTPSLNLNHIFDWLDKMVVKIMAFNGLNLENMTRENDWALLNMGRCVESAASSSSILDSLLSIEHDHDIESSLFEAILLTNESLFTYRYRNRGNFALKPLLDLLIVDQSNPRSIVFQLDTMFRLAKTLPNTNESFTLENPLKAIYKTKTQLKLLDVGSLCTTDPHTGIRKDLKKYLADISTDVTDISNEIIKKYFNQSVRDYSFVKTTSLPEV